MRRAMRLLPHASAMIAVLFCSPGHAAGEAGAQFLRIGVGPRACAMGGAFVGVADDASAVYWNPAGMTQVGGIEVLAMHGFWIEGMSHEHVAGVVPLRVGNLGGAVTYSPSGDIPKYEDFQQQGEFSAHDLSGTIAYAVKVGGGVSAGLGLKVVQQVIEEEQATGVAGDVGVLWEIPALPGARVGASVAHVGPGIKFIAVKDPLPLEFSGGASYKTGPALVALNLCVPKHGDVGVAAGAEVVPVAGIALRAGYNSAQSFSAGVGFMWRGISVDYAFVPYENLDTTHRISAKLTFGERDKAHRRGRYTRRGRRGTRRR